MDYSQSTSSKDMLYNLVYKTGYMMDLGRIIYKLLSKDTLLDKEIYVVAKSFGSYINVLLQTDLARPYYAPLIE